jgi:hypothetical protein
MQLNNNPPYSNLGQVPAYGDFAFLYKNRTIYVHVSLNNVARYKPDSFWDWLLYIHPFDSYIVLTLQHIIDEEKI